MATKPTIILEAAEHREKDVILIKFQKNQQLIDTLREINGVTWSQTRGCWYIPKHEFNLNVLLNTMREIAYVDYRAITRINPKETPKPKPDNPDVAPNINLKTFRVWLHHRRYSESTIKIYSELVKTFLDHMGNAPLEQMTNDDVVNYVYRHIVGKGYSLAYQNQMVSALKLFFSEVGKSKIDIDKIRRPRREHKLPNVLSKDEVKRLLSAPKNIKHRAMLTLIYACGLRRSELLHLKPNDIESKRGLLVIRQSKGNKDRIVPLTEKILEVLREYYLMYKPKEWLFEGQQTGEQYTATSLQKVLKDAAAAARITKPVTLHWLRHSYATHLLESGTDLRYIQELLGHKNSKTTEIYTHVSTQSIQKIKSPFDDL